MSKKVKTARAYVTALGNYRLYINGSRVGNDVLTPGFTDFKTRTVSNLRRHQLARTRERMLQARCSAVVWFSSGMSWTAEHFPVGGPARLLAQIEITFTDGTHETLSTDAAWKASPIAHRALGNLCGRDVRRAAGRSLVGTRPPSRIRSGWQRIRALQRSDLSQLDNPPQVVMTSRPERVSTLPNGAYVYDMGQNMVGWAALRVNGKAGTTVRLRFAEILNPDGSIYTKNLRNADATDSYILRGEGQEVLSSHLYVPRIPICRSDGLSGRAQAQRICLAKW